MGKRVLLWEPCYSLGNKTVMWVAVRKVRTDILFADHVCSEVQCLKRLWILVLHISRNLSWWIDNMHQLFLAKNKWKVNFQGGRISPNINYAWGNLSRPHHMVEIRPCCLPLLLGLMHQGLTVTSRRRNKFINGSIQRGGRKFLGHFIRHNLWQITNITITKQGHTKRINPKFDLDLIFECWVLMLAKQMIVYWELTRLRWTESVTFVADAGFIRQILHDAVWVIPNWWYLCSKMAYKMPQDWLISDR